MSSGGMQGEGSSATTYSAGEVQQNSNPDNQARTLGAPRIQRVESAILLVEENVYWPCRVSIGPCNLNRGKNALETKRECLEKLLKMRPDLVQQECLVDELEQRRTNMMDETSKKFLNMLVKELKQRRTMANGFYPPLKNVDETSEEFLNMLVRDGCYILYHFLNMENIISKNVEDPSLQSFLNTGTDGDVVRDVLYIFENQIPFDILETLYSKLVGQTATQLPLRKLMVKRVHEELEWQNIIKPSQETVQRWYNGQQSNWEHLLELVHKIITEARGAPPPLLATTQEEVSSSSPSSCAYLDWCFKNNNGTVNNRSHERETKWHRAKYYDDYAAVSFVHRPLDGVHTCSILDVKLGSCGRLGIPPLTVDTDTMTILHNLMVLEKYSEKDRLGNKHVTSYCFFLSRLAREVQDVALLSRKLILENNLPNDSIAATKISNIISGFSPNPHKGSYLQATAEALDSRFHSRIFQTISWFKLNKLRNPAMAIVSMGGIVIFVFAIVQAVYAIKTYKRGH